MNKSSLSVAQQVAEAACVFERQRTVTEARKAVPSAGILFISLRRFIIVTT